nr:MAG TPA: hypothetical protein [Caudoviricetes sp.]
MALICIYKSIVIINLGVLIKNRLLKFYNCM